MFETGFSDFYIKKFYWNKSEFVIRLTDLYI